MKILIDSREQLPFSFSRWPDVVTVAGTLATGDYSMPGLENRIALERKSLDDLVMCLMGDARARFERELARGRGLDVFAVIVEASMGDVAAHRYRSRMEPHAVMQSVVAFQVRYRVPFLWCDSRNRAEYVTLSMLQKFRKQLLMDLEACLPCPSTRPEVRA